MLMMRLARFGAKKKPTYRVVIIEKQKARDGSALEVVGHYDPRKKPLVLKLEYDRVEHWLKVGAKPSATVARLLKNNPAPVPEPSA